MGLREMGLLPEDEPVGLRYDVLRKLKSRGEFVSVKVETATDDEGSLRDGDHPRLPRHRSRHHLPQLRQPMLRLSVVCRLLRDEIDCDIINMARYERTLTRPAMKENHRGPGVLKALLSSGYS